MITTSVVRGLALAAALAATATATADPARGRLLYSNFCYHCHLSEIHFRVNSKIGSWTELRQIVAMWQEEMGLGWGIEDTGDVASFLNRTYYGFPSPAEPAE